MVSIQTTNLYASAGMDIEATAGGSRQEVAVRGASAAA
jgi:hypothetical protein